VATKRPRTDLAFQDDAALADPAQRASMLDAIAHGGGKYIRANVIYGKTQGGKDLSQLDALVDAARQRGLRVQATLMGTPQYMASAATDRLSYKRPDPKVMAQFARTVAQHEHGRIGRYSIWNEPDLGAFLGVPGKDRPLAYRRLYQAGQKAVQGVSKGNEVLLGEVSPYGAQSFLKSVLRRGNKPLTTSGYAIHPYNIGGAEGAIGNLPAVKRLLAAEAGKGRLLTRAGHQAPLYLTEFGEQLGNVPGPGSLPSTPEPQRQRDYVNAARLAAKVGAREMLYYQLGSSAGAPPSIAEGGPPSAPDSRWDTQLAPSGDLERAVRALVGAANPVARARRR
jgi:hypothetical protein